MDASVDPQLLKEAYCWEPVDTVPGRQRMTAFRRRLRYHQAQWRQANGHPIGSQPISPRDGGKPARPLGSRIPLDYARRTGANFVATGALDAARARLARKEPHQMLFEQRLWADLLSSMPMCFNLFGQLASDHEQADHAVRAWWPDVPGTVADVRFEHSPGRRNPEYLGNGSAFDVALVLQLDDAEQAVIGIETKYHECIKADVSHPDRLPRYLEVAATSGVFRPGAVDAIEGTELHQIWLDHLLVLSMLQHPSSTWRWGRFVLVYPAGNEDFADACARYRELLADDATFSCVTIEDLLGADALPESTSTTLRDRYLPR